MPDRRRIVLRHHRQNRNKREGDGSLVSGVRWRLTGQDIGAFPKSLVSSPQPLFPIREHLLPVSSRQPEPGFTPTPILPVLEAQATTMPFGNLPAQYQADPRSRGLSSKERNEQICGVG